MDFPGRGWWQKYEIGLWHQKWTAEDSEICDCSDDQWSDLYHDVVLELYRSEAGVAPSLMDCDFTSLPKFLQTPRSYRFSTPAYRRVRSEFVPNLY